MLESARSPMEHLIRGMRGKEFAWNFPPLVFAAAARHKPAKDFLQFEMNSQHMGRYLLDGQLETLEFHWELDGERDYYDLNYSAYGKDLRSMRLIKNPIYSVSGNVTEFDEQVEIESTNLLYDNKYLLRYLLRVDDPEGEKFLVELVHGESKHIYREALGMLQGLQRDTITHLQSRIWLYDHPSNDNPS